MLWDWRLELLMRCWESIELYFRLPCLLREGDPFIPRIAEEYCGMCLGDCDDWCGCVVLSRLYREVWLWLSCLAWALEFLFFASGTSFYGLEVSTLLCAYMILLIILTFSLCYSRTCDRVELVIPPFILNRELSLCVEFSKNGSSLKSAMDASPLPLLLVDLD